MQYQCRCGERHHSVLNTSYINYISGAGKEAVVKFFF